MSNRYISVPKPVRKEIWRHARFYHGPKLVWTGIKTQERGGISLTWVAPACLPWNRNRRPRP